MSPHRQLSQSSNRKPTGIQDIFLGFASDLKPVQNGDTFQPRKLEYTCVLHDGMGVIESQTYTFDYTVHEDEIARREETKRFSSEVLSLMRDIQTNKAMNVRASACHGELTADSTRGGR